PVSQFRTADGVWKTAQANCSTLRPCAMRSWRIRAPISCADVTSGLRRCARARPAAGQEHDQDHERHDGVGQSWHLQANVPVRRRGQASVKADFKRLSPHRREQRRDSGSSPTARLIVGVGLLVASHARFFGRPPFSFPTTSDRRGHKPPRRWWGGKIYSLTSWGGKIYSVTSSSGADFLEESVSERGLLIGPPSRVPLRVSRSSLAGWVPNSRMARQWQHCTSKDEGRLCVGPPGGKKTGRA